MTLRTGNKGFTFIEVMVTAVILSLGTVMIQGGLLRAADILNRYSNTLIARQWIDEKIWKAQEDLIYFERSDAPASGTFTEAGREFSWSLKSGRSLEKDTHKIVMSVTWSQGGVPLEVVKEVYAAK